MNTQHSGMNAFDGFAEKVAATMKPLTEEHVQRLAEWLYFTKKPDSMEAALASAQEQVQAANQRNVSRFINSPRQGDSMGTLTDKQLKKIAAAIYASQQAHRKSDQRGHKRPYNTFRPLPGSAPCPTVTVAITVHCSECSKSTRTITY